MVFRTVFGNKIAILKRNPWMKINPERAKKSEMWASGPAWTGNPAARPPGVKAINDIFAYIARKLKGYTVRDRVEMVGRVMKDVHACRTAAEVDSLCNLAIKEFAPTPAAIPMEKRAALKAESRARVPALEALAKALGA